jgi:hypothetical protein
VLTVLHVLRMVSVWYSVEERLNISDKKCLLPRDSHIYFCALNIFHSCVSLLSINQFSCVTVQFYMH